MSFLRKQESSSVVPPNSPSRGLAFGQDGLWTARPEAAMLDSRLRGNDTLGLAHPGERPVASFGQNVTKGLFHGFVP